jgi:hypothetical protein
MPYPVRAIKNFIRKISIIGITVKDCEKSFLTRNCDWISGRETAVKRDGAKPAPSIYRDINAQRANRQFTSTARCLTRLDSNNSPLYMKS